MKKNLLRVLICTLVLVMVFSVSSTVFAANSDMSDFPLTTQGQSGNFPWAAQLVLKHNNILGSNNISYLAGPVDGIFGGDTYNAAFKFQQDYKACGTPDGKIGVNTWKQLKGRLIITSSMSYYTNYRPGTRSTADHFQFSSPVWSYKRTSTSAFQTLKS